MSMMPEQNSFSAWRAPIANSFCAVFPHVSFFHRRNHAGRMPIDETRINVAIAGQLVFHRHFLELSSGTGFFPGMAPGRRGRRGSTPPWPPITSNGSGQRLVRDGTLGAQGNATTSSVRASLRRPAAMSGSGPRPEKLAQPAKNEARDETRS